MCIYTAEDESGNPHRILLKEGRVIELRAGAASIVLDPAGRITLTAANDTLVVR